MDKNKEQVTRESSDPAYDPLDNRGMCLVWVLSLIVTGLVVLAIAEWFQ